MNREDKTPPNFYCLNCRYSLHALPGNICPECGQAFDLSDPATYTTSSYEPHVRIRGETIVVLGAVCWLGVFLVSTDIVVVFENHVLLTLTFISASVGIAFGIYSCRHGGMLDRVFGFAGVLLCSIIALLLIPAVCVALTKILFAILP